MARKVKQDLKKLFEEGDVLSSKAFYRFNWFFS